MEKVDQEALTPAAGQAKPEFITVFEVQGDCGSERGGEGPVEGYCDTRPNAVAFAQGKGWWGSEGKIVEVTAIVIDGKVYPLRQPEPVTLMNRMEVMNSSQRASAEIHRQLREETLAELTPEQRRNLGFDERGHHLS
jgi:hypothetical protein